MKNEIQDLKSNNTWILTDLSLGKKAIDSKWVYKIRILKLSIINHIYSQKVSPKSKVLVFMKLPHMLPNLWQFEQY